MVRKETLEALVKAIDEIIGSKNIRNIVFELYDKDKKLSKKSTYRLPNGAIMDVLGNEENVYHLQYSNMNGKRVYKKIIEKR